jgi:aldehyde:ferredoxin oxidoreductase
MQEIIGTSNRVLDIDLSGRTAGTFLITENDRRMFLGGKGLGLKYLYERLKPGIDPLGAENILAFMMGVLMGTGAPCSGRFAVRCISILIPTGLNSETLPFFGARILRRRKTRLI